MHLVQPQERFLAPKEDYILSNEGFIESKEGNILSKEVYDESNEGYREARLQGYSQFDGRYTDVRPARRHPETAHEFVAAERRHVSFSLERMHDSFESIHGLFDSI